ncbi:hypothetical protein V5F38_08575 [Xanthobacter sp. V0B-10]|uniref:hypothetical protein n=1 Tax=Xanthobacter albus TaxID=3119929 RepID=UPI00372BD3E4
MTEKLDSRVQLALETLGRALAYFNRAGAERERQLDEQELQLVALRDEIEAMRADHAEALAAREREIACLEEALAQRDAELRRATERRGPTTRLWRWLAFHRNGRPRGWMRALGRRRLAADARRLAAPDVPLVQADEPPADTFVNSLEAYHDRMRSLLAEGRLAAIGAMAIVAPPRLQAVAGLIADCLRQAPFRCALLDTMPQEFPADLYLVLAPQDFPCLPPADRRIMLLAEGDAPAGTAEGPGIADLARSLAVFSAGEAQIRQLHEQGINLYQTFLVPLQGGDSSCFGTRHMLLRALHGCGVLDDDAFERLTQGTRLEGERFILCFPEDGERLRNARLGVRHGATLFPSLRAVDGWKGTALSYRYLARRALLAGRERLVVWEDDAALDDAFAARLANVLDYLERSPLPWDVFSGLLSDISERMRVMSVELHGGDLFARVDQVIGMVFGIYSRRALQMLAAYRVAGDDTMRHTIDRYLEAQPLSCVTVFPPLVEHAGGLSSTLWSRDGRHFTTNASLEPTIRRSQARVIGRIGDHLARSGEAAEREKSPFRVG